MTEKKIIVMETWIYIGLGIGILWGVGKAVKEANEKKQQAENETKKKMEKDLSQKKRITERLKELKTFSNQVREIAEIKVTEINEFKNFVLDNEKIIIEKGGDDKLYQFLKVDTFLLDFRKRILNDIKTFTEDFNEKNLEKFIIKHELDDSIEALTEKLNNRRMQLEGKKGDSLNAKIERLFNNGKSMKPAIHEEIETLNFYKSMALAMLIFYLEDKKVRFFEIYEAFDQLGALDSSWQKNIASKLDSIDMRLADLNNKMTELNERFIRLAESADDVARELKQGLDGINNKLDANNILQAITTYQVYKINKKTKSVGS